MIINTGHSFSRFTVCIWFHQLQNNLGVKLESHRGGLGFIVYAALPLTVPFLAIDLCMNVGALPFEVSVLRVQYFMYILHTPTCFSIVSSC